MKASEILRRAAERWVSSPARGWLALDVGGIPCDPRSSNAVAWCALGAIRAEVAKGHWYICYRTLEEAALNIVDKPLPVVNDRYPELMPDVWSEAIEAAEAFEARTPRTGDADDT